MSIDRFSISTTIPCVFGVLCFANLGRVETHHLRKGHDLGNSLRDANLIDPQVGVRRNNRPGGEVHSLSCVSRQSRAHHTHSCAHIADGGGCLAAIANDVSLTGCFTLVHYNEYIFFAFTCGHGDGHFPDFYKCVVSRNVKAKQNHLSASAANLSPLNSMENGYKLGRKRITRVKSLHVKEDATQTHLI